MWLLIPALLFLSEVSLITPKQEPFVLYILSGNLDTLDLDVCAKKTSNTSVARMGWLESPGVSGPKQRDSRPESAKQACIGFEIKFTNRIGANKYVPMASEKIT